MSCTILAKKNLGLSRCNDIPGLPKSMISTPVGFAIPAATLAAGLAAVLAYLQDALLDSSDVRIYRWPDFDTVENISQEPTYEDGPLIYKPVRDGNYRFRFGISQNLCLHKAMYTHRQNSGRIFIIDENGKLIGTELSNGDFAGMTIQMLNTEKFIFNDGSVVTKSPIVAAFSNNKELDANGFMLDISSFVEELYRIVDVTVTVFAVTDAGDIDVDVKTACDDTPLTGLVVGDFVYLNAAGVAVAITTAVPNANVPGRYKLTQVGDLFVDGTVNIKSPDQLSIKAYESLVAAAVNIP